MIYTKIISNIQKYLGKGSCCIIDSVIHHNISISKYNNLAGSSRIRLPKEQYHPRKVWINIQNIDENECFQWSIVRYLNPVNHCPAKNAKAEKDFFRKLGFKGIKFLVKIKNIHKIAKKNLIGISVFGYDNRK